MKSTVQAKSNLEQLTAIIERNRFDELKSLPELWVFGYASLVWLPNFDYSEKTNGHVNGFSRRFYQESTSHRGTPEQPGRCATVLRTNSEDKT